MPTPIGWGGPARYLFGPNGLPIIDSTSGQPSQADIMTLMNEQVGGNLGDNISRASTDNANNVAYWQALHRDELANNAGLRSVPAQVALLMMGGAAAGGAFRGAAGTAGTGATTYPLATGGPVTAAPLAGGAGSATVTGANAAAGAAGGIVPGAGGAAGGGFSGGAIAPAAGGAVAGLNWATLVPSIVSGVTGILGAREQAGAAGDALALSERMFDQQREDALPRIRAGNAAVDVLADLQGLYTGTPNMARFTQSPDYQFNLQQGTQAGERALGAMGLRQSGPMVKEAGRFASGLASSEYGSFVDRLLATAGLGTTGAAQSAAAGANNASIGGNALMNQGAARSSGYGAINDAVQGGYSNYLLRQYLNRGGP